MSKIKQLYEEYKDFIMEVIHFGIVGVMNTLIGWVIMAGLYNLAHFNYWLSSGISYFVGSVYSYFMNSRLTFKVEKKDKWLPWRFALNIIVCYGIAYGIAKPTVKHLLSSQPTVVVENVAMLLGMCLFIVMNFFGQKLFVFRKRGIRSEKMTDASDSTEQS
jgi:putative flippase GtrA